MTDKEQLILELHGLTETHVVEIECSKSKAKLHRDIINDWDKLKTAAINDGFNPTIISGFRSFDRQQLIWNRKFNRESVVNDRNGQPLPKNACDKTLIEAMLTWSAIPGYSRHHWGTDFDLFDIQYLPEHYKILLEPHEFLSSTGPCYRFNYWLEENLNKYGFYRPFSADNQGVAKEPWHISHHSQSKIYSDLINQESFCTFLLEQEICGADILQSNVGYYFDFFVKNPHYETC